MNPTLHQGVMFLQILSKTSNRFLEQGKLHHEPVWEYLAWEDP